MGSPRAGLDAQRVFVEDPQAQRVPLMPIFGAQATLSFIVQGVDTDEVARRCEAMLRKEFGDALGRNMKVLARPVENRRVDVFTADGSRTPLAVGILSSEVSFVIGRGGGVEVSAHTPGQVMFGS